MNKKFYFYGAVTYPVKDFNEVPKGSIGLHYIETENEELAKKEFNKKHKKINDNLIIIDMFGKERKDVFRWYGELNDE
jgi:hypothetical protein